MSFDELASSLPTRRPQVASEELDGETVLFDGRTGALHVLNAVGGVVWDCLDGDVNLGDLADELADAFGTDPAVVRADIFALVDDLVAKDVVVIGNGDPAPATAAAPGEVEDVDPVCDT